MLDLRDDGTIGITLPGKETLNEDGAVVGKSEDLTVSLRRPVLDELLDLWADLDQLTAAAREPDGTIRTGVTMRLNAGWMRDAIVSLGPPGVYSDKNGESERHLVREDLAEPAWFVNGHAAAQMLNQWQTVPLAPGLGTDLPG